MMRIPKFCAVAATVCLVLWIASPARAAEPWFPKVGYSADMKMDMSEGRDGKRMIVKGKIYASPNGSERREIVAEGQKNVIIKRRDKQVTWILMPQQKMYMENRAGENERDPEGKMQEGDVKFTKLGSETVNGMRTTKYKIEAVHKDGGRFIGHRWVTKQNIPVRMEGTSNGNRIRIDYTNIKTGKQDPRLFEIPAGYQKFATPGMPGRPPMGMKRGGEMPQGMPPGGMTKEQAEQMRKQMQEMMKQMQKKQ